MLFKPYSQLFSNSATLFARLFCPKHKGRRQRMSAGIRPALRPYLRVASKGRSFPALVYSINAITKSARLAASPTRRTPDCPRILQTSTRSNPRSRTRWRQHKPLLTSPPPSFWPSPPPLPHFLTSTFYSSSSCLLRFLFHLASCLLHLLISSSRSYIFLLLLLFLVSSISSFLPLHRNLHKTRPMAVWRVCLWELLTCPAEANLIGKRFS